MINYPFGKRPEIINKNIVKNQKSNITYKIRGMDFENGVKVEQGYMPRLEILKAIDEAYFHEKNI